MTAERYIPAYGLYGEGQLFPEILHVEKITDRAKGLSWNIAPHRHPHLHQFLITKRGTTELTIDGRTMTLSAPSVINIPPWAVHGFAFSSGTEGLVVSLPVAEFPTLFDEEPLASRLKHWQISDLTDDLSNAAATLHASYLSTSFARETILRALGTNLGALVAGTIEVPRSKGIGTHQDDLIVRFERLVRDRFKDRLKLTAYANALAVSPSHLSRSCRQTTGVSASRFIESVLFKEACSQLAYTRLPIQKIGYDLGFDDAAYFSRAFRKHTGMSPGSYRKSTTRSHE